jgi:hypothetical protein
MVEKLVEHSDGKIAQAPTLVGKPGLEGRIGDSAIGEESATVQCGGTPECLGIAANPSWRS